MKELLQAHRVNLATSQNLRFARTTLYTTTSLTHTCLLGHSPHSSNTRLQNLHVLVFRVVKFYACTHTQSISCGVSTVFASKYNVYLILPRLYHSLSHTHSLSLSFSQESIESLEKELQTLRERTSRGVGGGGEGELQTPHQLNIPPITLPVSWNTPPPPHTHYSPPVAVSGAVATISTEDTVFS